MGVVAWLFSGVGVTIALGLWRLWQFLRGRSRPKAVAMVVAPELPLRVRTPPLQQLKERARVLVVDDVEFGYLEPLQADGFNVEWRRDLLSTTEIEQGAFDVVLIDLHGVGTSLGPRQGIGVIQQIKRASPAQMLIAYSSASWPVSTAGEVSVADRILDKAVAMFPDFREALLELLRDSATVNHYLDSFRHLCSSSDDVESERHWSEANEPELSSTLNTFIATGSAADLLALEAALAERGIDKKHFAEIEAIANLARRRLSPWMTRESA